MEGTDTSNMDTEATENEPTVVAPPASKQTVHPEYSQVKDTSSPSHRPSSINRFLDVEVTVSAELGRVDLPIGELLDLGEGSVVELGRSIAAPVDLMAQGQRVASGEVVVIDDCFAIRITSINSDESDT